ncbi:MAG: glutamine synthetase III [Planctomycetia bacterium]|nr:glutamine synthetase III [Planctomycetia bacterium]
MSNCNRIHAIDEIAKQNVPESANDSEESILNRYGEDVFNTEAMRRYLSPPTAEKLRATIDQDAPLDASIAESVAHAMKEWALARGATHFTHWFQPLTGATAEKHDAFLNINDRGEPILAFSGKNLIMGEPDASSFPSGGLRCTFEARGYTAWDPTSPAFIKRHSNGATLCIPTVFCSYTGEVLDKKTPLLRSIQALKHSIVRLMKCFKQPEEHVSITLGAEQEYFLIDKKFYFHRPDLIQTGRTLFGSPPAKHQQLDDHYFGAIKPRILAFMADVERELWKLGVPAKTRHNEVAPAQFEVAPIFEDLNLAVDHNMLVMEVLKQVASRHGFICLMHEKPFAGINGSGKHNNWAISYGGRNLLDPGNNPLHNAAFMTILAAIIRAADLHSDLLRASTACAGNDFRLGANEAPPAIISIFLGDQLDEIVKSFAGDPVSKSSKPSSLRIGVDSLPPLSQDATDRNRTSPFAFTGNKFEFRACGSSQSCAGINMVLNTIVAESIDRICDDLETFSSGEFNDGLQTLIKAIFNKHNRIIFNGDNYSPEWKKEAERRGLPNLSGTMAALKPLLRQENKDLFKKYKVLSETEVNSRYEVFLEEYHGKIRIEGGVALEIARNMILPIVAEEYGRLVRILESCRNEKVEKGCSALKKMMETFGQKLDDLYQDCEVLEKALGGVHEEILQALGSIRKTVDAIEELVPDNKWPLPKYREMLFVY